MVTFLALITLTLLITVRQSENKSLDPCLLSAQKANSFGSLCEAVDIESNTLRLYDCVEIGRDTPKVNECQKYIDDSIENVLIRINNLISHKALTSPQSVRKNLVYDITIKDAKEPSPEEGSDLVFANASSIELQRLSVRSSSIKLSTLKNLVHNFKLLQFLYVTELKDSDAVVDDQLFPSGYFANLRTISIRDSIFSSISKNAFTLDDRLTYIELVNLQLKGEGIATHAFNAYPTSCSSSQVLKVDSCQLTTSLLKPDILTITGQNLDATNCIDSRPKLSFNFTNNLFERVLPESAFTGLVEQGWIRKKLDIRFHSDSIDCCHVDNKWLFKLISTYPDSQSHLAIKCVDLDGSIYAYKNVTSLDETCNARNVFPVLTITIISILSLTVLLAVFSFICVYYVLPRRGNIIMLNSANRNSAISYAKTGEITHVKTSHVPKAKSKSDLASIYSNPLKPIKTARLTQESASIATRKTEVTQSRRSAKSSLKERSLDRSTQRSGNTGFLEEAKKESKETHAAKKAFYGAKSPLHSHKTIHKSTPTTDKPPATPRSPLLPSRTTAAPKASKAPKSLFSPTPASPTTAASTSLISPKSPISPRSSKESNTFKTINSIKSA